MPCAAHGGCVHGAGAGHHQRGLGGFDARTADRGRVAAAVFVLEHFGAELDLGKANPESEVGRAGGWVGDCRAVAGEALQAARADRVWL